MTATGSHIGWHCAASTKPKADLEMDESNSDMNTYGMHDSVYTATNVRRELSKQITAEHVGWRASHLI